MPSVKRRTRKNSGRRSRSGPAPDPVADRLSNSLNRGLPSIRGCTALPPVTFMSPFVDSTLFLPVGGGSSPIPMRCCLEVCRAPHRRRSRATARLASTGGTVSVTAGGSEEACQGMYVNVTGGTTGERPCGRPWWRPRKGVKDRPRRPEPRRSAVVHESRWAHGGLADTACMDVVRNHALHKAVKICLAAGACAGVTLPSVEIGSFDPITVFGQAIGARASPQSCWRSQP